MVLKLPGNINLLGILEKLYTVYMVVNVVICYVVPAEARLPFEEVCKHRCKCDEILLRVNCTHANLKHVPDIRTNTRALILDKNVFTVIDEAFFVKLTSLRHLSLSWNKIDDIQDGSFRSQRKVIKLDMRNNYLGEVPLALKHMKSLMELDLRWNQIGVLTNIANGPRTQEPWSNVTNLRILRLDHNLLTLLPVVVFSKLVRLQYLSASYNNLVAIPDDALVNLNLLEYINLSFNNLTSSAYSRSLPFNTTFDVIKTSDNEVSVLDELEFSTAPTLDTDYIADNSAYGITTSCFKRKFILTKLYLQHNQIQALLTGVFSDLLDLKILHLERNHIEVIENGTFDSLLKLRELHLQENVLQVLPQTMFQPLRNLEHLKLNRNFLVDISPLTTAPIFTLTRLSLDTNNIRSVPDNGFTNFPALEILYFNENQLEAVPAVKGLSHLQIIDLSYNYIREITPLDAFAGTQLEIIDLRENALQTISFETFSHLQNTLKMVKLSGSSYICDCRLQWTFEYDENNPDALQWMYDSYGYREIDLIECHEPQLYKGKPLSEVKFSNENHKLRCTTYIESHMITILLSSWGAILGFFLLIFWIHTLFDFKSKFGTRHPRKRYMAMHYADNPGANPLADETGQITFRTFDSDSEGPGVVDEETTV